MPDEPVMTAAPNFRTVITPLAKSAPSTAHIDRSSPDRKRELRMDYGGKQRIRQKEDETSPKAKARNMLVTLDIGL
jgi:hypothetical protein